MVRFSIFTTSLGDCGIAWCGDTVVATRLPDRSPAVTAARLTRKTDASEGAPPPAIQRAIASITALLEGAKADLNFISCDFSRIDAFSAGVYAATQAIPAGETRTYGAVATALGDSRLARDVGQALGRNPFPIIVPCHRVMGANDKLTGFSTPGGITTKLRMLAIEGAQIGAAPGLFGDLPRATRPRG